ncbi:MAG TPA: histidine kinase dimerization/phosphoacceptor domain -containing protein, partial [Myxococcales bacterium]|nr:histidine kinase dimerization/phosphoacceptor domain -containing protein [Myxococcales bacterium]
ELHGLRKDGRELPIEIGLTPLHIAEGLFVLSSVVEISERKRAEEHFRLAIEAAPTGMIMVDARGRIVLVNAQVEALFGYPRSELIGALVETLVPQRHRSRHGGFRAGFFSDPHARPMGAGRELHGLRKDGTEVPIEIGLNPLTTSEGSFVLSSIVDITERRRAAEALERSLLEKETLLKELHHRVKNNLQVISSLLSLQSRAVGDAAAAAMLRESQNRVQSISLVHEKLYESNDLGRVDFGEYLQALGQHLQGAWASGSQVTIQVDAGGLRLPVDLAVPCGLIVNELVTNAFKHAFPGGQAGSVVVRATVEPDGAACLQVEDDGVGMPPERAAHPAAGETLGMTLVSTLARQIGAALQIGTGPGTRVRLDFRVKV